MIELGIKVQQVGGYLVMKYHAEENSTSTEPEKRKGTFVENDPKAADLPEFPDFGQPGVTDGQD
jgi:hypothetical protein